MSKTILFSCVSDPQSAKELVFGNCGVLQEINTTKVNIHFNKENFDHFCAA